MTLPPNTEVSTKYFCFRKNKKNVLFFFWLKKWSENLIAKTGKREKAKKIEENIERKKKLNRPWLRMVEKCEKYTIKHGKWLILALTHRMRSNKTRAQQVDFLMDYLWMHSEKTWIILNVIKRSVIFTWSRKKHRSGK